MTDREIIETVDNAIIRTLSGYSETLNQRFINVNTQLLNLDNTCNRIETMVKDQNHKVAKVMERTTVLEKDNIKHDHSRREDCPYGPEIKETHQYVITSKSIKAYFRNAVLLLIAVLGSLMGIATYINTQMRQIETEQIETLIEKKIEKLIKMQ